MSKLKFKVKQKNKNKKKASIEQMEAAPEIMKAHVKALGLEEKSFTPDMLSEIGKRPRANKKISQIVKERLERYIVKEIAEDTKDLDAYFQKFNEDSSMYDPKAEFTEDDTYLYHINLALKYKNDEEPYDEEAQEEFLKNLKLENIPISAKELRKYLKKAIYRTIKETPALRSHVYTLARYATKIVESKQKKEKSIIAGNETLTDQQVRDIAPNLRRGLINDLNNPNVDYTKLTKTDIQKTMIDIRESLAKKAEKIQFSKKESSPQLKKEKRQRQSVSLLVLKAEKKSTINIEYNGKNIEKTGKTFNISDISDELEISDEKCIELITKQNNIELKKHILYTNRNQSDKELNAHYQKIHYWKKKYTDENNKKNLNLTPEEILKKARKRAILKNVSIGGTEVEVPVTYRSQGKRTLSPEELQKSLELQKRIAKAEEKAHRIYENSYKEAYAQLKLKAKQQADSLQISKKITPSPKKINKTPKTKLDKIKGKNLSITPINKTLLISNSFIITDKPAREVVYPAEIKERKMSNGEIKRIPLPQEIRYIKGSSELEQIKENNIPTNKIEDKAVTGIIPLSWVKDGYVINSKDCCIAAKMFQYLVATSPIDEKYRYESEESQSLIRKTINYSVSGAEEEGKSDAEKDFNKKKIVKRIHKPDKSVYRDDWVMTFRGKKFRAGDIKQVSGLENVFESRSDGGTVISLNEWNDNLTKLTNYIREKTKNLKNKNYTPSFENLQPTKFKALEYGGVLYKKESSKIKYGYEFGSKYGHGLKNYRSYQAPYGSLRKTLALYNNALETGTWKYYVSKYLNADLHNTLYEDTEKEILEIVKKYYPNIEAVEYYDDINLR